jgi:hypothetical protein
MLKILLLTAEYISVSHISQRRNHENFQIALTGWSVREELSAFCQAGTEVHILLSLA